MAFWTTIPDASLEPGKPIRSIDALALRDNPIAIADGATGAPRVKTAGIDNSAVTTEKIANANVTDGKLSTSATSTGALWVGARTALLSVGDTGTYTVAWNKTTSNVNRGDTIAGSNLSVSTSVAEIFDFVDSASTTFPASGKTDLTGTWRAVVFSQGRRFVSGASNQYQWFPSLWLRIS